MIRVKSRDWIKSLMKTCSTVRVSSTCRIQEMQWVRTSILAYLDSVQKWSARAFCVLKL